MPRWCRSRSSCSKQLGKAPVRSGGGASLAVDGGEPEVQTSLVKDFDREGELLLPDLRGTRVPDRRGAVDGPVRAGNQTVEASARLGNGTEETYAVPADRLVPTNAARAFAGQESGGRGALLVAGPRDVHGRGVSAGRSAGRPVSPGSR